MLTKQEKFYKDNLYYTRANYEESLGKYPHYFVTSSSPLPSHVKAFYFRVRTVASVTYVNDLGGESVTAKTFDIVGEEIFGDFSTLTVSSGEIIAYVK